MPNINVAADIAEIFTLGDFDIAIDFFDGDPNLPDTRIGSSRGRFTDSTHQTNIMSAEIETVNPMFDVPTADIAAIRRGYWAQINGTNYTIERIQELGTGLSTLHLKT